MTKYIDKISMLYSSTEIVEAISGITVTPVTDGIQLDWTWVNPMYIHLQVWNSTLREWEDYGCWMDSGSTSITIYNIIPETYYKMRFVSIQTLDNYDYNIPTKTLRNSFTEHSTFYIGTGFSGGAILYGGLALKSDDSAIYAAGTFTSYSGVTVNRIVKLNNLGTFDSSWTGYSQTFNSQLNGLALDSSDRLYVAGNYTSPKNRILRLSTDGSIDTGFDVGAGCNQLCRFVTLRNDGKLYLTGQFTQYKGTTRNRIVCVNDSDGSIDGTFTYTGGFNNAVYGVALKASDNSIYCSGNFTSYNGTTANRIAHINADGTLDTTFQAGIGTGLNNYAISLALDESNNRLYAVGIFTQFSGVTYNRIMCFNATDGTPVSAFNDNIGAGLSNLPYKVAIHNGKIYVTSNVSVTYNGVATNGLICLNDDATQYNGFTNYVFNTGTVYDLAFTTDSKIYVGGNFTTYNSKSMSNLARIYDDGRDEYTPIESIPITSGLIARWTFDDGDLTDSSGNGNDLVLATDSGKILYSAGKVKCCLHNNVVSTGTLAISAAAINSTFNGTNDFTEAGWFKTNSATGSIFVNRKDSATNNAATLNSVNLALKYRNRATTDIEEVQILSANTWYHFAQVFDSTSGETRIYIDGALVKTVTESDSITVDAVRYIYTTINAQVDNYYVFNRVLTLEEIQQLYNET